MATFAAISGLSRRLLVLVHPAAHPKQDSPYDLRFVSRSLSGAFTEAASATQEAMHALEAELSRPTHATPNNRQNMHRGRSCDPAHVAFEQAHM